MQEEHLVFCAAAGGCLKLLALTLLHSERPKLYGVLAFLSAIELN